MNDHIKPARIAFKRNTKFKENEEDNEDQERAKASIALKSYYINNKFASAFSRNLQINDNLNSLILKRTNLTDANFQLLFSNIPVNLKKLDISKNPSLTIRSYRILWNTLIEMRSRLTHLNLEDNHIGD